VRISHHWGRELRKLGHDVRLVPNRYIRTLLIVGMTSRALMAKNKPEKADTWTAKMLAETPFRLATVAMANKSARIIWALLTKREEYRQPVA